MTTETPMIQHIVLLKLKPDATAEQKAALLDGLIALKKKFPVSNPSAVGTTTVPRANSIASTGASL